MECVVIKWGNADVTFDWRRGTFQDLARVLFEFDVVWRQDKVHRLFDTTTICCVESTFIAELHSQTIFESNGL